SFDDVTEGCELPVELKLIGNTNEELRTGAVGLTRQDRRDDGALSKWDLADLRLESQVEAAGTILRPRGWILGFRVSRLNNPVRHGDVEYVPVVKTLAGQLDELPHMVWSFRRIELHDELSGGRVENGLQGFGIFLRGKHEQQKCKQQVHDSLDSTSNGPPM